MIPRLQEKYKKEILPKLKEELKVKNDLMTPRLEKVVVNVGFGSKSKEKKYQEAITKTLTKITGQKPLEIVARKSISNFKLREGMVIGMKTTLRGVRMYEFIDRLISVALPRVRDFRGIRTSTVDKNGNLNIGFKEQLVFPEITADYMDVIHGLEVVVVSTAKDRDSGYRLFELLGVPLNPKLEKKVKKKSKNYNKK